MINFTAEHLEKARNRSSKPIRTMTDNEFLSMIENATHSDCELLAASSDEVSADELYGFVLGDNESERAFELFKDDIEEAKTNFQLYKAGL